MKILVIADDFSKQTSIAELIKTHPVDAIFTLGDLYSSHLKELQNISIPKFGVYGNHCSEAYMPELGIKNLHLQTEKLGELTIGGFEGCHRYKENGHHQFSHQESVDLIKNFPKVDILLTHAPPLGVNDDWSTESHQGLYGTLEYIKSNPVKILFHGHTYPKDNHVSKIENTIVVYTYGFKIWDLDEILTMSNLPTAKRYR
ncbi:MAG: metallophosphoesterase family protein [Bdellovibrionaceae bacterium]|nr:metallophosphoesterase family protein [Pseudobdellovibrionaceae bacterium]